jgi:hypothetical protein
MPIETLFNQNSQNIDFIFVSTWMVQHHYSSMFQIVHPSLFWKKSIFTIFGPQWSVCPTRNSQLIKNNSTQVTY